VIESASQVAIIQKSTGAALEIASGLSVAIDGLVTQAASAETNRLARPRAFKLQVSRHGRFFLNPCAKTTEKP
jgi:hypothetical protein